MDAVGDILESSLSTMHSSLAALVMACLMVRLLLRVACSPLHAHSAKTLFRVPLLEIYYY